MNEENDALAILHRLKRQTAVHEAAHAVVGLAIGWDVRFIQLSPGLTPSLTAAMVKPGDGWGNTVCAVQPGSQHDLVGVKQALAGHVAERLFAPETLRIYGGGDDDPYESVVRYLNQWRSANGDRADVAGAFEILDNLPMRDGGPVARAEREAAFEEAVRHTTRCVLSLKDSILRVAAAVETVPPGARLDGAEIAHLAGL